MNDLFIFVHIPKTSGEVIKRNIESTIPRESMVRASFEYYEPYFDIIKKEACFYQGRDHFHQYIQTFSAEQKRKIKFVAGHDAYFGIHHLFSDQANYVTFMRDPVARTISLYNFEKMAWTIYAKKENLSFFESYFLKRIKDHFLIDDAPPSFAQWLHDIYDKKTPFYYTMSKYLQRLGFLSEGEQLLRLFHFIGATERHAQDAAYLYKQFNIKKQHADKNASTQFASLETLSRNIIRTIIEKNATDILLYNLAVKRNKLFRKRSLFYTWHNLMKSRKRLINEG